MRIGPQPGPAFQVLVVASGEIGRRLGVVGEQGEEGVDQLRLEALARRQLEAGGLGLEESLKLWERGEVVAAVCQERLEGVRKRLEAAAGQDPAAAGDNDET